MTGISTITICYNNLHELLDTVKSVDVQLAKPLEHIIIDGSSTFEIKEYLESVPQPAYRKWICESDRGISDAFNKGILMANGNIIHLLNAGDRYFDAEVLKKVWQVFDKQSDVQWLHGKYIQTRAGLSVISGKPFDKNLLYRGMRQVGHPTMFVRQALYQKFGMFSLEKKIAMDYDFLLRISNEKFVFLEEVLVRFAPQGVSEKNIDAGLLEVEESYQRIIGSSMKQKLWFMRIKLINKLLHTGIGKVLYRWKQGA